MSCLLYTSSCADIDDWNLKDAVIEFTVSKNNGDEQTFTKNLSGVKSYADVMNALTVPGLTISANSTGTYDVSVLITFKGCLLYTSRPQGHRAGRRHDP